MLFQEKLVFFFIRVPLALLVFLCSLWLLPARTFAGPERQVYSNWAAVHENLVWNNKNVYLHIADHTHVFKGLADPLSFLPACLEPIIINWLLNYLGGKWLIAVFSRVTQAYHALSQLSAQRKYQDTEYTTVPLMRLPQVLSRRLLIQFDRTMPGWEIYPVPVNPVAKEHFQQLSPYLQSLYRLWEVLRRMDVSTLKIHHSVNASAPEMVIESGQFPPVVVSVNGDRQFLESHLAVKIPEPFRTALGMPRAWLFSEETSPADFTCTLLETKYLNLVADILECVADHHCRAQTLEHENDRYRYHRNSPEDSADKPGAQTLSGDYLSAVEMSDDSEWLVRIKDPDGWLEPGREVLIYHNGQQAQDDILNQLDHRGSAWILRQTPDFTIVPYEMGVQLLTKWFGYVHQLWSESFIGIDQPAYREEDLSRALVPLDIGSVQDWEFKSPLARAWLYEERIAATNYFTGPNTGAEVAHPGFLSLPVQSNANPLNQGLVPVGAIELRRWLAISPLAPEFRAAVLPGWIAAHLAVAKPVQAHGGQHTPTRSGSGPGSSSSKKSGPSNESSDGSQKKTGDNDPSKTGDGNKNPEDRTAIKDSETLQRTARRKRKTQNVPEPNKYFCIQSLSPDGDGGNSQRQERIPVNCQKENDDSRPYIPASSSKTSSIQTVTRLEGELKEKITPVTSLIEKLRQLREEKNSVQGELNSRSTENAGLIKQAHTLEKKQEELQAQVSSWKEKYSGLADEFHKIKETYEQELEELRRLKALAESELGAEKELNLQSEEKHIEELRQLNEHFQQVLAEVETIRTIHEQLANSASEENSALQNTPQQLQGELSTEQTNRLEVDEKARQLEKNREELKQKLTAEQEKVSELATELKANTEEFFQRYLQHELEILKKNEEIAELQEQLVSLKTTMDEQRKQPVSTRLRTRMNSSGLQNLKQELSDKNRRITELKEKLETARRELKETRSLLEKTRNDLESLEKVQQKRDSARPQVEQLRLQLSKHKKESKEQQLEQQNTLAEMRQQLTRKDQEYKGATDELVEKHRANIQAIEGRNAKLETQLSKLKTQLKEAEKTAHKIQGQLDTTQKQLEITTKNYSTSENNLSAVRQQLSRRKKKASDWQKNIRTHQTTIARVQGKLSRSRVVLAIVRKGKAKAVKEKNRALKTVKELGNKLAEQAGRHKEDNRILQEEISQYTGELDKSRECLKNQEEAARLALLRADNSEANLQKEKELARIRISGLEEEMKALQKLRDQERLQTEDLRKDYEQQLSGKDHQVSELTVKNQVLTHQHQQELAQLRTTLSSREQELASEQKATEKLQSRIIILNTSLARSDQSLAERIESMKEQAELEDKVSDLNDQIDVQKETIRQLTAENQKLFWRMNSVLSRYSPFDSSSEEADLAGPDFGAENVEVASLTDSVPQIATNTGDVDLPGQRILRKRESQQHIPDGERLQPVRKSPRLSTSEASSADDETIFPPDDSPDEGSGFGVVDSGSGDEGETDNTELQELLKWTLQDSINSAYEQALATYALKQKWRNLVTQDFNRLKMPLPVYENGAFTAAKGWSNGHINYFAWKYSNTLSDHELQMEFNSSSASIKFLLKLMKPDHRDYEIILKQYLRERLAINEASEVPLSKELSRKMNHQVQQLRRSGIQPPKILEQGYSRSRRWGTDAIQKLLETDGLVFIDAEEPVPMKVPGLAAQVAKLSPGSPEFNMGFYRLMELSHFHLTTFTATYNSRSKRSSAKPIRLPDIDGLNFPRNKLHRAALVLWLVHYQGNFKDLEHIQVLSVTAMRALEMITDKTRHNQLYNLFLSLVWHYAFADRETESAEKYLQKNLEKIGISKKKGIQKIRELKMSLPEVKFKDVTLTADGRTIIGQEQPESDSESEL